MAFVPIANTAMAELRMTLFGQQIENTLYFHYSANPVVAELNILADDLIDWWDTDLSTVLSSEIELREVHVTNLTTVSSAAVTVTPASETRGKDDSPSVPGNVAFVVSFRTINRGRSFRGRNYVPAIPSDQVTGNTVASGVVIALVASYTALRGRHTDLGDGEWVVASRFSGGAPRVSGVISTVTSVVAVDSFVDSQRRRLTGRGL
jgi:predicted PhzF superfamily epimerase YddE/YHI9